MCAGGPSDCTCEITPSCKRTLLFHTEKRPPPRSTVLIAWGHGARCCRSSCRHINIHYGLRSKHKQRGRNEGEIRESVRVRWARGLMTEVRAGVDFAPVQSDLLCP